MSRFSNIFERLAEKSSSSDEIDFIESDMCITDEPDEEEWFFCPLFKSRIDSDEKDNAWQIGYKNGKLITLYGMYGGKVQRAERVVSENLSGRSLLVQGLLESRSKFKTKYDQGYRPVCEKTTPTQLCRVMLASKYSKEKTKLKFPCIIQPKIDGVRCVSCYGNVPNTTNITPGTSIEIKDIVLRSREGKEFDWLEHIRENVLSLLKYLPPGTILDGEIYVHGEMIFNDIISAVKSKLVKEKTNKFLQYWIFDWINYSIPNWERLTKLKNAYNKWIDDGGDRDVICLVNTYKAGKYSDIERFYGEFIEQGFEGLMIRHHEEAEKKKAYYKAERSVNLLKYKEFQEAEGIVVDVVSAQGKDSGTAIFLLEDPNTGVKFRARPGGTLKERKKYYDNREELIGKLYTYKYFELTIDGVPRFPVGKGFRDYE